MRKSGDAADAALSSGSPGDAGASQGDIDKELAAYNAALTNYGLSNLGLKADVSEWKAEKRDLNLRIGALSSDAKAFKDKYGVKVALKLQDTFNPVTSKNDAGINLEIDLAGLVGRLLPGARKEAADLKSRSNALSAEASALDTKKKDLDATAVQLKAQYNSLVQWRLSIIQKQSNKNYATGMNGGAPVSIDLANPSDPDPGTEEDTLDPDWAF